MKKTILILILLFIIGCYGKTNKNSYYVGKWIWEKSNQNKYFSITIKLKDKIYEGYYTAVFMKGNRIDASPKNKPSFKFNMKKTNIIYTKFKNYYSGNIGKIKLVFHKNKLEWFLIKEPKGIFYVPRKAILIKSTNN